MMEQKAQNISQGPLTVVPITSKNNTGTIVNNRDKENIAGNINVSQGKNDGKLWNGKSICA